MNYGAMYGQDAATPITDARDAWVKQRWVPWSPFAITEIGTSPAILSDIYRGNGQAVSAGFPEDGTISFFRAGRDTVGQSNSNIQVSDGKFDWPFDIAGLCFKVTFPRSIVDGADLRDIDGNPVTDPLAARRLASRYTRFFELMVNNSMLIFRIAEDEIARVPLEWVGSGTSTHVEGLSISAGDQQTFSVPNNDPPPTPTVDGDGQTTGDGNISATVVSPSVAAFSARIGEQGKKDLWSLGEGARLVEQQSIELLTTTDPTVVSIINRELLAPGNLYEDARVGIRLKMGLFGDRVKQANYGAM